MANPIISTDTKVLEEKDRLGHGSNKKGGGASPSTQKLASRVLTSQLQAKTAKPPEKSAYGARYDKPGQKGHIGEAETAEANKATHATKKDVSDKAHAKASKLHQHAANVYSKLAGGNAKSPHTAAAARHQKLADWHRGQGKGQRTTEKRPALESLEAIISTAQWVNALEDIAIQASERKIDTEKGIVYDVKILGNQSKSWHKRFYPTDVIEEAIPLYEGATVNVNHPPKDKAEQTRDFNDGIGVLRGVYVLEGELYAKEFHYNTKHTSASRLEWNVVHAPHAVGFSHNAAVLEDIQGDKRIVRKIQKVRSVDLVSSPATTNGIFESEECRMSTGLDTGGMGDRTMVQEDDAMLATMIDKLREIWAGEGDHVSKAKAIQKTAKAILKACDEIDCATAEPGAGDPEDLSDEGNPTPTSGEGGNGGEMGKAEEALQENQSLKTKLLKMERREKARALFDTAEIRPTDDQVEAVSALENEEQQQRLVNTWKPVVAAAKGPTKPTSLVKPKSVPASALESTQTRPTNAATVEYDPAVLANTLRGRS